MKRHAVKTRVEWKSADQGISGYTRYHTGEKPPVEAIDYEPPDIEVQMESDGFVTIYSTGEK